MKHVFVKFIAHDHVYSKYLNIYTTCFSVVDNTGRRENTNGAAWIEI